MIYITKGCGCDLDVRGEKRGFTEVIVMLDLIIEICADIAEIFVDNWVNKIASRFKKKKQKNDSSEKVS